jgi:hypothetical protein
LRSCRRSLSSARMRHITRADTGRSPLSIFDKFRDPAPTRRATRSPVVAPHNPRKAARKLSASLASAGGVKGTD